MHVLVTGASGAIGSRLVRRLTSCGYGVTALSRREPRRPQTNVAYSRGDLLDGTSLERAVRRVDCVVHLAALTHTHDQQSYHRVNVAGTGLLAAASARHGVRRFIFVSSRAASEQGGAYGLSKLRAENEVKSAGVQWVILRPSEVYGAGANEAISKIIRAVMKGPVVPIIGRGDARVAPVYVDDVLGACVEALVASTCVGNSYVLAGPEEMTLAQLVSRIENKLGMRRPRLNVPVPLVRCLALLAFLVRSDALVRDQVPRLFCPKSADISAARADLRYNPRTLEQGLEAVAGFNP